MVFSQSAVDIPRIWGCHSTAGIIHQNVSGAEDTLSPSETFDDFVALATRQPDGRRLADPVHLFRRRRLSSLGMTINDCDVSPFKREGQRYAAPDPLPSSGDHAFSARQTEHWLPPICARLG